jgi:cytochrome b6-f complex iron-sulfur subunit
MEPVSRRALLAGACGIAALSISGLPAASANTVKKLSKGRLSVSVNKIAALKEVGSSVSVGTWKGRPVALARTGPSAFIAFSLMCPHQGFTVTKNESGWLCDLHGSRFKPDGELVSGLANTRLPRVRSRVSGSKVIIG